MDSEKVLRGVDMADDGTGSTQQGWKEGGKKEEQEAEATPKEQLLTSLTLSGPEVVGLVAVLHEKNPGAVDTWYRSQTRSGLAQLEEASVHQLSREPQVEQHETSRAARRALDPAPGTIQDLQAQLDMKDQEIQKLQAELEAITKELRESAPPYERESMAAHYAEFQAVFLRLEKQMLEHIERGRRALRSADQG